MSPMITAGIGFCSVCLFCMSLAGGTPSADVKALAKEVNADIRKADNMLDKAAAKALVAGIRVKIDRIRSMDPDYVELRAFETKYKRLAGLYGGPAPSAPPASPQTPAPSGIDAATKDWEALAALHQGFIGRLEEIIPTHVKSVIYTEAGVDAVIAKIADLRREAPSVKAGVEAFAKKYGRDRNAIDDKMETLRDPKNRRPSPPAGECLQELTDGLTNLDEAPRLEAKKILTDALRALDRIEGFVADTERDKRYAQVDAKLRLGLKFNPADAEIRDWVAKVAALRQKSKADIEKSMDEARFPGPFAGFTGPGTPADLEASCIRYFNQSDPSQTTVKVSVAGNWVVAKKNIFGEPVQWGLPIWAAGSHHDDPSTARVFKMTMITGEGLGIAKSPPWTGAWVGDSFRMRAKNIR